MNSKWIAVYVVTLSFDRFLRLLKSIIHYQTIKINKHVESINKQIFRTTYNYLL